VIIAEETACAPEHGVAVVAIDPLERGGCHGDDTTMRRGSSSPIGLSA
jgi:hypothetical protein